jgi:hypothetical protein
MITGKITPILIKQLYLPFKPLPRTLSQRGFKTTIPQIDFTKYGLNGIRHPKLQDLNVSPFILPSAGMSAETHDHILNIQKSLPFAKRNNLEFGQESSSRRTYHSEGGLFLGRESITRHDIPQTRRYLVKISPLKMGFLAAREAASVYVGVAMGIARHEAKTNAVIHRDATGDWAVITRQFFKGVDGFSVLSSPESYPETYISNTALASIILIHQLIRGDSDIANPGNVIMADNTSKVVGELSENPKDRKPTLVIIDAERCFPNDQLMTDCVVPATGMEWVSGMPYPGSLEWRRDRSQSLGHETFLSKLLESEDPAIRLLMHRLGPNKTAELEISPQVMTRVVNALPEALSYLKYFQVYSPIELNKDTLPIKTAVYAVHKQLISGRPLRLGDVLTGRFGG